MIVVIRLHLQFVDQILLLCTLLVKLVRVYRSFALAIVSCEVTALTLTLRVVHAVLVDARPGLLSSARAVIAAHTHVFGVVLPFAFMRALQVYRGVWCLHAWWDLGWDLIAIRRCVDSLAFSIGFAATRIWHGSQLPKHTVFGVDCYLGIFGLIRRWFLFSAQRLMLLGIWNLNAKLICMI